MKITPPALATPRGSDKLFRELLHGRLRRLRQGCVTLQDGRSDVEFGDRVSDLRANVVVHHPRFFRRMLLGGGLGAAESLMDGDWSCRELTDLVRIFIRNMEVSDGLDRGAAWFRRQAARLGHWQRRNTVGGSRRNIHEHYDLGNDFFSLFLDDTMNYSCGVFEHPDATMGDASTAKMEQVCRKLALTPNDHLLEIGTGWGSLAIYAAKNFGCRVTTTTISREQFEFARARAAEEGLSERVTVLLQDFRKLSGKYDKLVSIEMIEAVGHQYFDTFFHKCGELLRPHGMMLIQSIVIADERYRQHLKSVDFIRRYIFPGGCLPSIGVLTQAAAASAGMRTIHLEDLAPHYARTLRCWRERFHEQIHAVRRLGFDEPFIRRWDYYLCYCEAGFEERQVNNVQMMFAKRGCRLDALKVVSPRPMAEPRGGRPAPGAHRPADCVSISRPTAASKKESVV